MVGGFQVGAFSRAFQQVAVQQEQASGGYYIPPSKRFKEPSKEQVAEWVRQERIRLGILPPSVDSPQAEAAAQVADATEARLSPIVRQMLSQQARRNAEMLARLEAEYLVALEAEVIRRAQLAEEQMIVRMMAALM